MVLILLHQLHDNLRSLRFQMSLAVLMLFFVANGVVYTLKIERLVAESARIEADDAGRYENVETVRAAADNWFRILSPPVGTEFITEAGFNWFSHALWINPGSGNTVWLSNVRTTNNWMRRFEVVDWTVIVRYVLSFLCIVLGYNAISGEIESGTLRLALANPLARASFLIGKFLAHLLTLLVSIALGSAISLLILALNGVVELNLQIWRGYLFFLLGTVFFTALFLLLSMGISALARSSASSLVLLVTAWTVLIVMIPQSSYLIAMRAVEPTGPFWEKIDGYEGETRSALEREGISPRPPELARNDDYALEKRYAQRLQEMEREMDRIGKEATQQELRQYEVARTVNLLSPGFAFQYTVEAFLGAGLERFKNFSRQGWRYRENLRQFLRGRDAADPDSPHVLFLPEFMSDVELDAGHIPRFKEVPLSLSESIAGGVAPIVILTLETALAFFFALWAFNRAELTG